MKTNKNKFDLFLVVTLCTLCAFSFGQKSMTISGTISDSQSGEGLIGAMVYCKSQGAGTVTNAYGFFSLNLKIDTGLVIFSFLGYQPLRMDLKEFHDKPMREIKLEPSSSEIKEIVIYAEDEAKDQLNSTQGNVIKVPMSKMNMLPNLLGESDIIKALQLMPGVTPGGEGSSSIFVRGGEADQNLVLLDEAVVYNSGHLLGFFSVFNSDILKDVKLYKGGFPSNYGGRVSSVMDVRTKDGNMNKFHGMAGVGLLSSKFTCEGPIWKNRIAFIVSGRRTYIDQVFKLIQQPLPYYFYDLNAKVNFRISDKDRVYLSAYLGNDVLDFSYADDSISPDTANTSKSYSAKFGFDIGNRTTTLRWNHIYSSTLFSNLSVIYNTFSYNIDASDNNNILKINSSIRDYSAKLDYDYYANSKNHISFGVQFTNHLFEPNLVFTEGEINEFLKEQNSPQLYSNEYAIYALDEFDLGKKVKFNAGLRYTYASSQTSGYQGLEPRISMNYLYKENRSLKLSYCTMNQYIHRISSSNFVLPTDMYYPVTDLVKPQKSHQFAMALNRNFKENSYLFTFEAYYKSLSNQIEFKEGTKLFLNNTFEKDLLSGTGESFGAEVLLQKEKGTLTGWLSYTLSWSNRHFANLNGGKTYYSRNDRRHNFSVVGIYKFNEKWSLCVTWIYMTGARFTPIIGQYLMPNAGRTSVEAIPIFAERNSVVMSPVHRLDFNFTFTPENAKKRRLQSEWQFGMYNLYNRAAPYRIDIQYDSRGFYQYIQPGLFGRILSVAYNLKF